MLTDSQCCWQYRALSISRKIQTAATHRWLSRDWLTCSCSLGFDNFIRCIKLSDWRLALARSQLLSWRLTWRRHLAVIDCLRNNFCTVYHFRVDDNHKACTRYQLIKNGPVWTYVVQCSVLYMKLANTNKNSVNQIDNNHSLFSFIHRYLLQFFNNPFFHRS